MVPVAILYCISVFRDLFGFTDAEMSFGVWLLVPGGRAVSDWEWPVGTAKAYPAEHGPAKLYTTKWKHRTCPYHCPAFTNDTFS